MLCVSSLFSIDPSRARSQVERALAPYGDADQLRGFMERDAPHRELYKVLLDVRNAAANLLDNTTIFRYCRSDDFTRLRETRAQAEGWRRKCSLAKRTAGKRT